MATWWVGKVRQTLRHVAGRVSPSERAALDAWLTPAQSALFDRMHPADRRHGLDVVDALRASGHHDPDLLLAGLFHDASKGHETRLWHRVTWSLGERYGNRILKVAGHVPGMAAGLERLRDHPAESARMAVAAGCPEVTAELIRHQSSPRDPVAGEALRLADEAS